MLGRWRWAAVAAMVLAAPLTSPFGAAEEADPVETLQARLPFDAAGLAAASAGRYVYLFGGQDLTNGPGGSDRILRFDPLEGDLVVLDARLPGPVFGGNAVSTGTAIYVFGGSSNQALPDGSVMSVRPRSIHRFDPATETVSTMQASLPWGTFYAAAAWDGQAIGIFGGCVDDQPCRVVRYDPVTDRVALGARLDDAAGGGWSFQQGAAFALGPSVYLFGAQARHDPLGGHRFVLRYDSTLDTLAAVPGHLPAGRQGASAAWDGSRLHLFGGINNTGDGGLFESTILSFDPLTLHWDRSCVRLPAVSHGTAAVSVGGAAFVFAADTRDSRHVYRVDLGALQQIDCLSPLSRPVVAIEASVGGEAIGTVIEVTPAVGVGVACAAAEAAAGAVGLEVQVGRVASDLGLSDSSIDVASGPRAADAAPPTDPTGLGLYLDVDADLADCQGAARIRLELNVSATLAQGAASIHYFTGDSWVDLSQEGAGGVVDGATPAQDLRVFATGYDAVRGVAWAEVNHTSVYGLGMATVAQPVLADATPAPAAAHQDERPALPAPEDERPAVLAHEDEVPAADSRTSSTAAPVAGTEEGHRDVPAPSWVWLALAALALAGRRRLP